jgi:hypothetical protein
MILNSSARIEGTSAEDVVAGVLEQVAVPGAQPGA